MYGPEPDDASPRTFDNHSPASVFDAQSLDNHNHFITGVSLRAATRPIEFLTLFVSIPYLGVGGKTTRNGSRTLSEYRLRDRPETGPSGNLVYIETHKAQVLVHQIWFLVFNNSISHPLCFISNSSSSIPVATWLSTLSAAILSLVLGR